MNEIIERISFKTTPPLWRLIRNIAGIVAIICLLIMKVPIQLPAELNEWLQYIVTISTTVTLNSHLTKK